MIKTRAGVPSKGRMVRLDSAGDLVPGTVGGVVTNQKHRAVAGARVSSSGHLTRTGPHGGYRLAGLSAGRHQVTVAAAGYATISRTVAVTAGRKVTKAFHLSPPGRVTGRIVSARSKAPIAGAEITYPGGSTATNRDGRYTISHIAAGRRSITASAIGFTSLTRTVTVTSRRTTTANLPLADAPTYVTGGVLKPNGDGIPGATVSINGPGKGQSVTTDSLGRYRLYVPVGTYRVTARASGYTTQTATAIVTSTGYTLRDFSMKPA